MLICKKPNIIITIITPIIIPNITEKKRKRPRRKSKQIVLFNSCYAPHPPRSPLQVWVFDVVMSPKVTDSPPGRGKGWVTGFEAISALVTHP